MWTNPMRAPRSWTAAPFLLAVTLVAATDGSDARDIPKSELVRLTGTDTLAGDDFGVSVSAYGTTLVVGAPGASNETGAVYVFVRQSPTVWLQEAKLVAPDGVAGDRFGEHVSVSANTLVVSGESSRRVAHVFWREGSTWTRRERFEYNGHFIDVAVDGPRVIVLTRSTGEAHVYRRNSSLRWIKQTILMSDSNIQDFSSVQMSDGMAVLGAWDFDDVAKNPGSAYVYTSKTVNGTDQWTRAAKLRPLSHASEPDTFGFTVDISQNRVLVGSWGEGGGLAGVGYYFERQSDGTWAQIHRFGSADGGAQRCFGSSVALHFDRALISTACGFAEGEPLGDPAEKSVDIFTRNVRTNVWTRQDRIKDPGFIENPVALSNCGTFIGSFTDDAVYVLPTGSC
jgi:hypothetical protein